MSVTVRCTEATSKDLTCLRLATVRTLFDEMNRSLHDQAQLASVCTQLVEELGHLANADGPAAIADTPATGAGKPLALRPSRTDAASA
jgi:hypothetical protein